MLVATVAQLLLAELAHRWGPRALQRCGCFHHSEGRLRLLTGLLALSPLAAAGCASWAGTIVVLLLSLPYLILMQPYVLLVLLVRTGLFDIEDLELFVEALGGASAQQTRNCLSAAAIVGVLLTGPRDLPFAAFGFALFGLAYWRLFSTFVRSGLLMPAILTSKRHVPQGEVDVRVAAMAAGEALRFTVGVECELQVTRLRVGGPDAADPAIELDAYAVAHPDARGRWALFIGGNGDFLSGGFAARLLLARSLGCSLLTFDHRDVGASSGTLHAASDLVEDAAMCVEHLLQSGRCASAEHLILYGQSMGGAVAAALAADRYPQCAVVNCRSFASLTDAAVGRTDLSRIRELIRTALTLGFGGLLPWAPPLETVGLWHRLKVGRKLLVFHIRDEVLGAAAALHTGLLAQGEGALVGTDVIRLTERARSPHNDDICAFEPAAWEQVAEWVASRFDEAATSRVDSIEDLEALDETGTRRRTEKASLLPRGTGSAATAPSAASRAKRCGDVVI